MNTLLNLIVAAALTLTFAFASELGPASGRDGLRAVVSPPADAGLATAASYDLARTELPIDQAPATRLVRSNRPPAPRAGGRHGTRPAVGHRRLGRP